MKGINTMKFEDKHNEVINEAAINTATINAELENINALVKKAKSMLSILDNIPTARIKKRAFTESMDYIKSVQKDLVDFIKYMDARN
jgi:hypothetical protein